MEGWIFFWSDKIMLSHHMLQRSKHRLGKTRCRGHLNSGLERTSVSRSLHRLGRAYILTKQRTHHCGGAGVASATNGLTGNHGAEFRLCNGTRAIHAAHVCNLPSCLSVWPQ
jgi:hypothetical protein